MNWVLDMKTDTTANLTTTSHKDVLKHIIHFLRVAGNPPGSLNWIVESDGNSAVQTTGSTLTLESVQLTDSGNYSCVASNLYGTVSSEAAQLNVNGRHHSFALCF